MALPDHMFLLNTEADTTVGNPKIVDQSAFATADVSESPTTNYLNSSTEDSVEFDISASSYSELYLSVNLYIQGTGTPDRPIFLLKGDVGDILRINVTNTSEHVTVDIWNGSTWDQIGSTITDPLSTARKVDIYFKLADSGGRVKVDYDQTNKIDFTGDTLRNGDATVDAVTISNSHDSTFYWTYWQALFIDNADTVTDLRLGEETTTSIGGVNTVTSGVEADVDQELGLGFSNTGTYMVADADTESATFNMASVDAGFAGYTVETVVTALLCHAAVSANVLYVKDRLRKSSTNYDGAGVQPADSAWDVLLTQHDVDPSTAAAWANIAAVEAHEIGFVLDTTA